MKNLKNSRGRLVSKLKRWSPATCMMLAVAPVASLWLSQPANTDAATQTWNGVSTVDSNWSPTANTTTNWTGNTTPAASDDLQFAGTLRLTNSNNFTAGTTIFNSITFNAGAGAFVLSGNALGIYGNISNLASNTESIGIAVTFQAGDHTVSNTGSGTLAFTAAPAASSGGIVNFVNTSPITITGGTLTGNVLTSTGAAYATVGGSDWASLSGSTITALSSYQTSADATTWATTDNVNLAGNTLADLGNTTINTLKLSGTTALNAASGSTLTVSTGGILVTGTGTSSITGGTLVGSGGTVKQLAIVQNDVTNAFTIGSVIANNTAATNLVKSGAGTLNLNGANSYTGSTIINGGTVVVGAAGNLGTGALVLGSAGGGPGSLTLNNNSTVSAINIASNSSSANVITIASGVTLTDTGVFSYTNGVNALTANVTVTGGGTLSVSNTNNSNFLFGIDNAANQTVTMNMSGLSNFIYNTGTAGTGAFELGFEGKIAGSLTLANTTNTITTGNFSIGNSNGKNQATTTLLLNGNTTINVGGTMLIGSSKGIGNVSFFGSAPAGNAATPALKIRAQDGVSAANITMANGSSGTSGGQSTVNLNGHYVDILANAFIVGSHTGNISNTGNFLFDDGVISATTLTISNSTGTANTSTGIFTVGSTNDINTATLSIGTGGIILGSSGNASTTTTTATLDIKTGGNVSAGSKDILKGSITGTVNSTLILEGGTLDLNTHGIGNSTAPINTVTLTSGTIKNIGSGGIFSSTPANSGGLNMNGTGTLVLGGTNAYTGATTVSGTGTLDVQGTTNAGSAVSVGSGTLLGSGTINGTVTVGGGNISGGDSILSGNGTLTLVNGLTVNSGNIDIDINTATSNVINVTGGSVVFNGGTLVLGLATGAAPVSGSSFNVITTGSALAQGGLTLNTTTIGRTTLTPSIVGNNLVVTVTGNPANLTWNNSVGGGDGINWDTSTLNWTSTAPTNPNQYFDGDNVTFNDSNNFPTNPNAYSVTLSGTVMPGSVTVNTASAYTISGGGAIAGTTGVSVSGTGSLALSTINTYTGNTSVSGGATLIVNSIAAGTSNLSSSTVSLNAGTLKWTGAVSQTGTNPISISTNGGGFDATPNTSNSGTAVTWSGALTMAGSGARVITLSGTDPVPLLIASNVIAGNIVDNGGATSIVKNGNNRWQLNGTNTFTGGITINAGGIRTGATTSLGSGPITVANGAQLYINNAATYTNNVSIAGIGPAENTASPTTFNNNFGALRLATGNAVLAGNVTLTGDARITGRSAAGSGAFITGQISGGFNLELGNTGASTGILTLSNINNNWTGNTTISIGTLKLGASGGSTTGVIPHGASAGNVIINGSDANAVTNLSTLDLNGQSTTINGLSSAGTVTQDIITNSSTTGNGTLSVGDTNANSSFSGNITDGATKTTAITKIGSGSLVLGGTNTFTGGLNVQAGSVQATSSAAFGGANSNVNITAGSVDVNSQSMTIGGFNGAGGNVTNTAAATSSTITLGGSGSSSYSGAIVDGAGTIAITKSGSGTQTLAGANTYTGLTTLSGGTLNVTGSLLSTGTVNVGSGSILGGTGSVGNVNLSGGGTINPGATAGATGNLTMSSLTTSGGTLQYDLVSGVADEIIVNGAAALDGSLTINVTPNTLFAAPGSYVLLTSTNLTGTPVLFTHPATRQTYMLDYNNITPNGIDLIVGAATSANLLWTGAGDGSSWDTTTQNWKNGANPDLYFQFDNVTFDDTATPNYNVNLTTTLTPSSVTVNTANTYTFSGGGSLSGATSVTVGGGGTLALNNSGANNYTGGTFVQNGKVVIGSASDYTGNYTLGNAATSGVLDLNGNSITAGNIFVSGTGTANQVINNGGSPATITSAGTIEIDAPIVDGSSTIAVNVTSGTLTLGGNSNYSGGTTVNSGATLQIGNFAPAGSVAGTITNNGTVSFAILNGSPSNGTIVSNLITGTGSVVQRGNSATILTANNNYTGTTTVNSSGTLYVGNGGTTGTLGTGTVTVNNSGSAVGTLVFDRSDTSVVAIPNILAGNGTITYEGGAVYTATATNTFTGAINIMGGSGFDGTGNTSLGSQASTGTVTVAAGSTFDDTTAPANVNFGAKQFSIAGAGTAATPAALYNSGTAAHTGAYQKIALSADATVFEGFTSTTSFARDDLRNNTPVLDLGGHTLTKNGGGQFTLVAATLTGGGTVLVNQGVFSFQTSSATSGSGNVVINTGADLEFYQTAAGKFNWNISTLGDATISSGCVSTGASVNGPISFTGNLSVGPTSGPVGHIDTSTGTNPLTLLGNVTESSGGSSLVKFGVDTVTLSGVNSWTGNTTVGNGVVKLGSATGLPTGTSVIFGDSSTNVGTLDLAGFTATVGGLAINPANAGTASSQIITNSNTTTASTLTYTTGTSAFGGVIQDGPTAGGMALTVSSGSLTLNGINTYTGNTSVNGGSLTVGGTGGLASGNISVAAGGSFTVALGGSIPNATNLTNNGTVNFSNPTRMISTLNGTTSSAAINLNGTVMTVTTGGSYVGSISDGGTGGGLIVPVGSVLTTGPVNVNSLEVDGKQAFTNTTIRTLSKVNTLTVAGNTGNWSGALDLTSSRLVVEDSSGTRAADITTYKDMVANNVGGTVGIFSSTAAANGQVVVVSDNAVRLATFGPAASNFGTGVGNVDANSILITEAVPGDANLDGVVDLKDLQVLAIHWQQPATDWSQTDFDGNGIVALPDLQALAIHWQNGVGSAGQGSGESFSEALAQFSLGGTSNVPEPMSLAILGLGGVVLASRRRQSK